VRKASENAENGNAPAKRKSTVRLHTGNSSNGLTSEGGGGSVVAAFFSSPKTTPCTEAAVCTLPSASSEDRKAD
jgi:hypothetical protein